MSDDGPDPATVLALLEDDCARTILAATSRRRLSAAELAERCDASLATVSRRLEDLADAGLVADRTRPRPDGHHDAVYAARLDRFEVRLGEDGFAFDLDRTTDDSSPVEPAADADRDRDAADELKDLWERF